MAQAIQIAARKVELKNKEESASETFHRVTEEKALKINRGEEADEEAVVLFC